MTESEKGSQGTFPPCGEELHDISSFPGEERYNQSLEIYNPAYSNLHPSFFAFPKSEKDVQRCLKCASEKHVGVVLRSGGHNGVGYSTIGSEGFVIYLSEMNQVVIDNSSKVIHVQAGARWREIYDKTGSSYLVVGGTCPSVGVSGYTLGGGNSLLSRYHGLAIDNLLSATMVTANGSDVVVANATINSDLFWALRGGGGGNFGAVTEFTFQLHPTHPNYVSGTMIFLGNRTYKFLKLLKTATQLPKEVNFLFGISPPQKVIVQPFFIGSYRDAERTLKPFIEIASSVDMKNFTSYDQVLQYIGKYIPAVASFPEMKRGCLLKDFSEEVAKFFYEIDIPRSCRIEFEYFMATVSTIAPNETAFYHRSALFLFYAPCLYSNTSEYDQVSQFEDNLFNSLMQGGHCAGGYINDVDPKVQDWQYFYYGENYKRLVGIKQLWNPISSGMLHFLQEIGSPYQPKRSVPLWKQTKTN